MLLDVLYLYVSYFWYHNLLWQLFLFWKEYMLSLLVCEMICMLASVFENTAESPQQGNVASCAMHVLVILFLIENNPIC